MNIHERNSIQIEDASSRPCNLLFVEQQIFASSSSCLAESNLCEEINSHGAPCFTSTSQTLLASDDGNTSFLETEHEGSQFESKNFEEVTDDNRDFLDDIDHHLHYQVDIEIEQFRSNLHNILSQRQHNSMQLSPLQMVPQFLGSPQDNNSSDCVLSSSSLADVPKMDDSLTPASSMHDFEEEASSFGVIHDNPEIEVERSVNQLLIKLQTASSILSNNLCREEYMT